PSPVEEGEKIMPVKWADLTLLTIKHTPGNTPTFTSRCLGYIGLTMYESVVHGRSGSKSMAGQLNELDELPLPEVDVEYNWELSLNAGQAAILKKLYSHAQAEDIAAINLFETTVYDEIKLTVSDDVAERSIEFGRAIAEAIFEWSKTDGGHEGYLNNFDVTYVVPAGPSYWTAPFLGQSSSLLPLHPYWGNNRTFLASDGALPVPAITPYSQSPTSVNYNFFNEVYKKQKSLSGEDKRIAAWWADDPSSTTSPPGHSYNLASISIVTSEADIFTAAEAYAKVGMAVADAFICCWKTKYTYHSIRPFAFIVAHIDSKYKQFWPEPPFPAFPSGHATQSAATAMALISIFGDNFSLIDNTYANRFPEFQGIKYPSRKFNNLWETAEECAYSRFVGGIHTRQDNETGTDQGKKIGENVSNLIWTN
ncbi:MAG TPA: vanadium-dependent haloperoxidase, partial [Chryseolinea sp.]|nr:vanadium-dependent haloperoxidase [Chryseolinea sp.]